MPRISLVEPAGDEIWLTGSEQVVHWKADPEAGTGVDIDLMKDGIKVAALAPSWNEDRDAVVSFQVPEVPAGSDYRVRVTSLWSLRNPQLFPTPLYAESTGVITIEEGPLTHGIRVISNTEDVVWDPKSYQEVRWQASPEAGTSVRIDLYRGGVEIASLTKGWSEDREGADTFQVPEVPTGIDYKIRVTSIWALQNPDQYPESLFGESKGNIIISDGQAMQIFSQGEDEVWDVGSEHLVHWRNRPDAGSVVDIALYRGGEKVANLMRDGNEKHMAWTSITVPEVVAASDYKIRVTSLWSVNHPDLFPEPLYRECVGSITILGFSPQ